MLVIRFTKTGRRGERKYRLVVAEKRSKRDGKPVDSLGFYEKTTNAVHKEFDNDKIKYWVSQGAKISPSAKAVIEGKVLPKKVKKVKAAN